MCVLAKRQPISDFNPAIVQGATLIATTPLDLSEASAMGTGGAGTGTDLKVITCHCCVPADSGNQADQRAVVELAIDVIADEVA